MVWTASNRIESMMTGEEEEKEKNMHREKVKAESVCF
jgi:hypothetical protein